MIHAPTLLRDLQRLLKTLEADLHARLAEQAELDAGLKPEWQAARAADRTAETYETWREEAITQAAAHWLLACVFLRFIEDNGLVERPYLSGPGERLALARDRHESYFRAHPLHSDREYLIACFREVEALPGMGALFDERHNPLFRLGVSGDAAMALLAFWQKVDPDSGRLVHDFTNPDWNTRFLGDLYQDLSEPARKRYALLQTPVFVEEFILARTLTPAIHELGYRKVRLIDPTCGSGHFLLGAFERLLAVWARNEPARNARDTVQRALDGVYGVDLNPYAVAIARFRLLVAALKESGVTRLKDAPAFTIHLTVGDSLLHGRRFRELNLDGEHQAAERLGIAHAYAVEDLDEVNQILGQQYHAVVGNPPYITVKDAALNAAYRARYSSCYMKYSLGVPFTQRFFELALPPSPPAPLPGGERGEQVPSPLAGESPFPFPSPLAGEGQGGGRLGAGYIGMITANSFMKREFGKKLIEDYLPGVDLTHVIDTSGAYIPGHGTPTVILFGRNRRPVGETVRTVMGIKGEPTTPDDPARGLVWRAIVTQVDRAGSESEFVSVADTPRGTFGKHPWSIGGGGAADLKEMLEEGRERLAAYAREIGITSVTGEDDLFILGEAATVQRLAIENTRPLVIGDAVRDYYLSGVESVWFYSDDFSLKHLKTMPRTFRLFWPYRSAISKRKRFGTPMVERGLTWYEWQELYASKLRIPLSITFAFVATHNHFVLDRGGKVFNRTAPVIKLPAGASEDEHLGLLGLLNSSVACFWFKQVSQNRGSTIDDRGARQRTAPFEDFYEIGAAIAAQFPLTADRALEFARQLDNLAQELAALSPARLIAPALARPSGLKPTLQAARDQAASIRRRMIALQEELDWRCYRLYGLLGDSPPTLTLPREGGREREGGTPPQGGREIGRVPEIELGQRAFEIVMARKMAAGELTTTWFERHRSTPVNEPPAHWPEDYRRRVERRIALIESDRYIGLIERPEYKRRWASEPWEEQEKRALRGWLLDRLETGRYWPGGLPCRSGFSRDEDGRIAPEGAPTGDRRLTSVNRLADLARADADFMQVAELYAGRPDFDVAPLVGELVASESVPFLPVLRYTESGLRKRVQWERTWELQRREDAIDARVEQALRQADGESDFVGRVSAQRVTRRSDAETATAIAAEQKRRKQAEIGDIPVPPKYQSKDFLKTDFWRLRGGLDVPKERFVSYPGCGRGADGSLVVAWAGWDHLQQATALATYYLDMKENEGWPRERLQPLLAGLLELVPWLKQWHNDYNAEHATRMGDYFESFVADEARGLGLTVQDLRGWVPHVPPARRGRRKSA